MSNESAERLIKAIIGTAFKGTSQQPARFDRRRHYVVTISRDHGALGGDVAERLAEVLGVVCADRQILESVAARARVDVALVESLDRHVAPFKGEWWSGLISGRALSRDQFSTNLVKVIFNIARRGGVIVGRGAHLMLGAGVAFRVRIVGCAERCSRRIAEREGLDPEQAKDRVKSVNHEREQFLRVYFGAPVDDPRSYDLTVNSDRFDVDAMVRLILVGMVEAGYRLPAGARV